MRKASERFEDIFFAGAAILTLVAALATLLLRSHLPFHKSRVLYGMDHLPAALLAAAFFTLFVGLMRVVLTRSRRLAEYPTAYYLAFFAGAYCLFWLPVYLSGGFVQDDWLLLAAASVRKIIYLHPAYSWYALDSVDGNFRPLGTVLYFGYVFKMFGLNAHAFLAGNFLLPLGASIIIFFILREMGYSKIAGAAGALLFLSRGVLYTIVSWASAISDDLAIFFCGLMALAILKASRRQGLQAISFHLLAWVCFCVATLGKQSSFAAPLIVALLLFLRPGEQRLPTLARRIVTAGVGLGVYAATAAVPFFHAKTLLQTTSPYPISFSAGAILRCFSYALWYFVPFDLPSNLSYSLTLPAYLGIVVVLGLALIAWKVPGVIGDRPRDVFFAALAAVASISLFVVLGTRLAPYYGTMAAFWMSIALAIVLTRFGSPASGTTRARIACFVFCLLVAVGFLDVRLRQTALTPAGGYTWGTYGMDKEKVEFMALRQQLVAAHPKVLVLVDFPFYTSYYTSMSLLADPHLQRIFVYDSKTKVYMANDLQGQPPTDDLQGLHDPASYNWILPIDQTEVDKLALPDSTAWLQFRDGNIRTIDSIR